MKIPKRPSIPIILFFALFLWASTSVCYTKFQELIQEEQIRAHLISLIITIIIVIAILLIILFKFSNAKIIIVPAIAILCGLLFSVYGANNMYNNSLKINPLNEQKIVFETTEDQKSNSIYNTCVANIKDGKLNNIKVKLQVNKDFQEIHAGDIIEANAKFSEAQESQIANYWQNGICVNANLSNPVILDRKDPVGLIYKYRNHLIDTIRNFDNKSNDNYSSAEGLLAAIICGQRIDLNSGDLYNSFKSAGLAHLVAVSGAHLSLVTAVLLVLLRRLKLKKWLVIFIQSIFILSYLICAAIPISALRAAFMAYIAMFSFFSKRRPAPLNALGVCIIILICLQPETSVSVSFALSAGSTLGIIIFSRFFEYWIKRLSPKCPEFINSALSLTFSASICSQPLSISIFNQFPIIAPVANIICTPIFSILCAFGLVSSVFTSIFSEILPIISQILMWLSFKLSSILAFIVEFLATFPYASIPATSNIYISVTTSILICISLYFLWPKRGKDKLQNFKNKFSFKIIPPAILCSLGIILLLLFIFPANSPTEISALDIGQGDAILLRSKGKNFLIDTGNQDNMLKSRLAENNIAHLDGIFITHPDDDHCGSLDVLQQLVQVDKAYVAKDLGKSTDDKCKNLYKNLENLTNKNSIIELSVGDKIYFGEIELNVIWPDKYKDNGGNCDSLCLLANIDVYNDENLDASALFCGDAEKDEIAEMQKIGRLPKIDIYKCGHHGSKNAITDKSIKLLSPEITLISVGEKNRYGHPSKNTIDQLQKVNSKIYRTDKNGTIHCIIKQHSIDIKTER